MGEGREGGLAHPRGGGHSQGGQLSGFTPRVSGFVGVGAYRLHPGVEGVEGRLGGRDGGLGLVELVRGGGVERAGGLRDVVGGSGGERRVRSRAKAGEFKRVARRYDRWTRPRCGERVGRRGRARGGSRVAHRGRAGDEVSERHRVGVFERVRVGAVGCGAERGRVPCRRPNERVANLLDSQR